MRNKLKMHFVFWLIVCVSGCTLKPVKVISFPAGAKVSNGKESCIAPCELLIYSDNKYIYAELPDGRFKQVEVSEDIANKNNFTGNLFNSTGDIIGITALALGAFAFVVSLLFIGDVSNVNDEPIRNKETKKKLYGLGLAAWGGFYILGTVAEKSKKMNKSKDRVEIDFIYEDVDKKF